MGSDNPGLGNSPPIERAHYGRPPAGRRWTNSMSTWAMPSVWLLAFGLLLTVSLRVLWHHDLLDDAYISAHYAQNIAHGYGWVWNAGTAPTDGTTAPLWTILLAAVIFAHWPIVTCALILNALFYALAGTAGSYLTFRLTGLLGACVCLLCFCTLSLLLPICAGMETPLYAALVITSLLAWHMERPRTGLLIAGMLPLVRGDGVLLLTVLLVTIIVQRRIRELWPAALVALVPILGWELFSLWQFHALLPNSYLAKRAMSDAVSGRFTLWSFLAIGWSKTASVWIWLGAALGIVFGSRLSIVRVLGSWLVAYVIFYSSVAHVVDQGWYAVPAWWVLPIPIGIGLADPFVQGRLNSILPVASRVTMPALVVLGFLAAPEAMRDAIRNVPPLTWSVHREAAAFLAQQPAGLVAAAEIGALGYYSEHPVVDILGLVSPEVVPHVERRDYTWILHKDHPQYVFIWTPPPSGLSCYEVTCGIWSDPWFGQHYRVIWRMPPAPHTAYAILKYE